MVLTGRVKEKELPDEPLIALPVTSSMGARERRMKNDQPAVRPLATNVYRTPARMATSGGVKVKYGTVVEPPLTWMVTFDSCAITCTIGFQSAGHTK